MKVNFSDFTNKIEVHNYLLDNSSLEIIKVEARLLDEDGVVIETSDDFLENCGDIKYYFEGDKSLEINRINSVAIFMDGNGQQSKIDYISNDNFELDFVEMLNKELNTKFEVRSVSINKNISGVLSGSDIEKLDELLNKIKVDFKLIITDNKV